MKKSLIAFLLMATFALTFTSCKKDEEEDNNNTNLETNSWKIGSTLYKTNAFLGPSFSGSDLSALSPDPVGTLIIQFKEKPTASGTYTVKAAGSDLGDKDVIVSAAAGSETTGKLYLSTGKSGNTVQITVTDSKVTAKIASIEISTLDGKDVASLEANITEK